MIITGKCRVCGREIGMEASDLGKKPPPKLCPACDQEAEGAKDVFWSLKDIVAGRKV